MKLGGEERGRTSDFKRFVGMSRSSPQAKNKKEVILVPPNEILRSRKNRSIHLLLLL
ncbi:hypothetical protein ACSAZK_04470 [Methanosarcina sp. Mfa9]|uniref:hypothetical protein n=1 Tax=Methanosarcina sp. Mfa9 TaxID=3439063 RepID=UPI003F86F141